MKTSRMRIVGAFLIAAVAVPVAAHSVGAQTPPQAPSGSAPTAATVAAWVETYYNRTSSMSARFTQRYVNRVYQRTQVSHGTVRFRRPGMMRFDYDAPNGKVVVSDGENLVVYEPPGDDQPRGQYFQQPIGDAQLPAALGFLMGTGSFTRDYRFRLLNPAQLHFDGQILELRPRRPNPHYTRILLFVDDNANAQGTIHRVVIIDHSNNQNRFDFTEQNHTTAVPESTFRWRPPANARRIQP
ncbi:MAG: outer membrane lipoprotein carrier protein LolA [Sandaracinaceae bacterium]